MLTLLVKYTAKPGCREKYADQVISSGLLDAIRAENGCLRYDYYFSVQEENVILLVEQWESEKLQQEHMQHPNMTRLQALKAEYIANTILQKAELKQSFLTPTRTTTTRRLTPTVRRCSPPCPNTAWG